jgi:DNA-binding transcriptional regulator YdaS (Cro superfamily)
MEGELTPNRAFQRAVELAGGQSAFGRLIGKAQTSVSDRLNSGKPIWHDKVLLTEEKTGVSRHDLRPDLYPRESAPDERTPRDVALDRRPHAGGLPGLEPAR